MKDEQVRALAANLAMRSGLSAEETQQVVNGDPWAALLVCLVCLTTASTVTAAPVELAENNVDDGAAAGEPKR